MTSRLPFVHVLALLAIAGRVDAVTWRELTPVTPPEARSSGGTGYDAARDRVILFGGYDGPGIGVFGDTWELDVASGEWRKLAPATSPSKRYGHAFAASPDALLVHGGTTDVFTEDLGDLWTFDFATDTWRQATPPASPPGRYDHNGLWDPLAARFVIYAGFRAGLVPLDDLWSYDPATDSWTEIGATTLRPAARTNCFLATPGNGTYYMFGGHDHDQTLEDMWAFDTAAGAWRAIPLASFPATREHQTSFALSSTGLVYQWSGDLGPYYETSELWAFSPATESWSDLTPLGGSPEGRRHSMAAAAADRVVVFGGHQINPTFFGDSWILSDVAAALPILAAGGGPDASQLPEVKVLEAATLPVVRARFLCYATTGSGVVTAAADLDASGGEDVVTGPGPDPQFGPHLRAFRADGTSIAKLNLYAFGTLKYGVRSGGADLDGDGDAEAIAAAGPGVVFGPHVRGFDLGNVALPGLSFFAYGTLKYGTNGAGGDLDGAGRDDIATGAGPGAIFTPHVRGFRYLGGAVAAIASVNLAAFPSGTHGADVAVGELDGSPLGELSVMHGPDPTTSTEVRLFDVGAAPPALLASGEAFPGLSAGGRSSTLDHDPATPEEEIVVSAFGAAGIKGLAISGVGLASIPELDVTPFPGAACNLAGGAF